MVNLKTVGIYASAVLGLCGIFAGAWAVTDDLGIRPVLNREITPIEQQIAANTDKLLWLELERYERVKERRPLTREECARYLKIAKLLGIPASC